MLDEWQLSILTELCCTIAHEVTFGVNICDLFSAGCCSYQLMNMHVWILSPSRHLGLLKCWQVWEVSALWPSICFCASHRAKTWILIFPQCGIKSLRCCKAETALPFPSEWFRFQMHKISACSFNKKISQWSLMCIMICDHFCLATEALACMEYVTDLLNGDCHYRLGPKKATSNPI